MSAQPQHASAIVVLVPEAETLVGRYRRQFDPSAATGMPAHITLLYPFADPGRIARDDRANLRACLADFGAFAFELSAIQHFPTHLLYLAPTPAEIFREITLAIWGRFPEFPPYGGRHIDIVPHLSVAQLESEAALRPVAAEFEAECRQTLPIRARATEAALMDNTNGRWEVRELLAFST
jgi:hypothetical protein